MNSWFSRKTVNRMLLN